MLTTPENAGDLDYSGDDVARSGPVRFNTKIAVVLREDLAVWQKLNMTAFLVSGVAGTDADTIGEPYEDASGHRYLPKYRCSRPPWFRYTLPISRGCLSHEQEQDRLQLHPVLDA